MWAGCSGAAAAPQWTSCGRAVSSAMLPNGAFSYTTSLTPAVPALAAALFAAGRLRSEVPQKSGGGRGGACALARTSIGSYEYAGDARTADARTARVMLSRASAGCLLKGAGREASVYPFPAGMRHCVVGVLLAHAHAGEDEVFPDGEMKCGAAFEASPYIN